MYDTNVTRMANAVTAGIVKCKQASEAKVGRIEGSYRNGDGVMRGRLASGGLNIAAERSASYVRNHAWHAAMQGIGDGLGSADTVGLKNRYPVWIRKVEIFSGKI